MNNSLANDVKRLKNDILKMKTVSNSTGDSATAYQKYLHLGDFPQDYNQWYRWDIYVEPQKKLEETIITPNFLIGYVISDFGLGKDVEIPTWLAHAEVDIINEKHIVVGMFYLHHDIYTYYGTNVLSLTSNAPFEIVSATKTILSPA